MKMAKTAQSSKVKRRHIKKQRNKELGKVEPKGFVEIPVKKLVKAPWNYKQDDETKAIKLAAMLRKRGVIENLVVRPAPEKRGKWEVVNGNHRLDALEMNGHTGNVMCFAYDKLPDVVAYAVAVELNETSFDADNIKLGSLLKSIVGVYGVEEALKTLPYDQKTLTRLSELADFDWEEFGERFEGTTKMYNPRVVIEVLKAQQNAWGAAKKRVQDVVGKTMHEAVVFAVLLALLDSLDDKTLKTMARRAAKKVKIGDKKK